MHTLPLLLSVVLLFSLPASSQWLEFNAGCPEGSEPLVIHNGTWDSFLTYDVELRGLLAETVTVASQAYLRFPSSPGTVPSDSVGWPELPVVRRMVWLPDDSDITLECSANCCEGIECLPVYPVPLDSLVSESTCTPYIGEYFRKDSSAYASEEWYPDTLARLVGEFRLRDLRVGIVDVYPVQYLASEDSLRVWSDIEVMLSWDEGNAVWSQVGLGHFDNLIGENLLGYTPEPQPINDGDGSVVRLDWDELEEGPGYAPDYVILVAAGLDGQVVTDLADHRDDLNGFDVAIVRTDDLLTCYGGTQSILTADMIRDFTEDMWEWGSGPGDKPTYLLLIGDHEDPAYASEAWFLPTRTTDPDEFGNRMGNDDWFVGFGESRSLFSVFPDMIVGRLPARTSTNLDEMIDLIVSFEALTTSWPPPPSLDWRRFLSRLTGKNETNVITTFDPWTPDLQWTQKLTDWLGYSLDNFYCGDGEAPDEPDGSLLTSNEWCQHVRDVFSRGSQIVFYIDHGDFHMFSAGLNWNEGGPPNFGIPDSSFDCLDVAALPFNVQHGWPFVLMLCCSAGTFNETQAEHEYVSVVPGFEEYGCFHFATHPAPGYDFGTTSLSEAFMLNTEGGAIGVFAGALSSSIWWYPLYGRCILERVSKWGDTRTGDAIQGCRFDLITAFGGPGSWDVGLGQFNLLGDPAVDLGDRVKFRDRCDLVVLPDELSINRYVSMPAGQTTGEALLHCVIRNHGAVASGSFTASMTVTCGEYSTTLTSDCSSIEPEGMKIVRFEWQVPSYITPPVTLTLHGTADVQGRCPDSWTANNDATSCAQVVDYYPNDVNWPVILPGSVQSPPCLADVDGDGSLEIAAVSGTSCLQVLEPDGELRWQVLTPSSVNSNSACEVFATGSVLGDAAPEIVIDCIDVLCVYDGDDGELLCTFPHPIQGPERSKPHTVVLADIVPETPPDATREEIAFVCGGSIYILAVQDNDLVQLDREGLPGGLSTTSQCWVSASDLDGAAPVELVVTASDATSPLVDPVSVVGLYRYQNGQGGYYSTRSWEDENFNAISAIGILAGSTGQRIALSCRTSDVNHNPALILDPQSLQSSPVPCQPTSIPSSYILCCMMADWRPEVPGLDRIIAPAESQCFVWQPNGYGAWSGDYEEYADAYRPPFGALGDLDDNGYSDLLVGTRSGVVMAYDRNGNPLEDLGFPYTLPSEVCGGYCIADIDNDGKVEVVFGTMDNYLHVWELGECDEGYASWPQVQHDAARTGVLE